MVCMKCGCEQGFAAQYCRECGTRLGMTAGRARMWVGAMPPPQPRVLQNLQPLGLMWCVFGAYRLLSVVVAATAVHALSAAGVFSGFPQLVTQFMPLLVGMTLLTSGAAMLTGYGLLTRRPWARPLAIVAGILALVKLPFGTALGIYTLWVLAPRASAAEWDAIAIPNAVASL
jgi:hypothetical protein